MAISPKTSKTAIARAVAIALLPAALIVGCGSTDKLVKAEDTTQISSEAKIEEDNAAKWEEAAIQASAELDEETVAQTTETEILPASDNMEFDTGVELAAATDESVTAETETETGELMEVNLSMPEPAKMELPEKSTFLFASNDFNVAEADIDYLKKHADYLKQNPGMELHINGYSDARGSAESNFKLSKKRAEQIHALLITLGAPEDQIKVNSYGEGFPVNDEKNWDENRRVELKYEPHDESIVASY